MGPSAPVKGGTDELVVVTVYYVRFDAVMPGSARW
jgi:hypothetical protein